MTICARTFFDVFVRGVRSDVVTLLGTKIQRMERVALQTVVSLKNRQTANAFQSFGIVLDINSGGDNACVTCQA